MYVVIIVLLLCRFLIIHIYQHFTSIYEGGSQTATEDCPFYESVRQEFESLFASSGCSVAMFLRKDSRLIASFLCKCLSLREVLVSLQNTRS